MTIAGLIGTRWLDTQDRNRPVVLLGEGGNGVWFRREDDGSSFHCYVEDLYLWGRFTRLGGPLL